MVSRQPSLRSRLSRRSAWLVSSAVLAVALTQVSARAFAAPPAKIGSQPVLPIGPVPSAAKQAREGESAPKASVPRIPTRKPPKTPHPLADQVKVDVSPSFRSKVTTMLVGARVHLDRAYTFDVVPPVLIGGLLFQGIHRPPRGTTVTLTLKKPARVYFVFHPSYDGGYRNIFRRLPGWQLKETAPQYDIRNGLHGRKMIMYLAHLPAGVHRIPATTDDRACFSLVFQEATERHKVKSALPASSSGQSSRQEGTAQSPRGSAK